MNIDQSQAFTDISEDKSTIINISDRQIEYKVDSQSPSPLKAGSIGSNRTDIVVAREPPLKKALANKRNPSLATRKKPAQAGTLPPRYRGYRN